MKSFQEAIGGFAEPSGIAGRERVEGADLWFNFGHTVPTLRKVAVKILSQTSSSSGCERNWSTRLDQLVYVHYNMRLRVKHLTEDPKQRGEVEYDPVDIGFLRDEEDLMVAWVARAITERGEYELDEEADDPEDPSRPNTFLARAVAEATAEEEGDHGNVGQPYSPHYEMDPEAEVDLLEDIELELVERRGGGRVEDMVMMMMILKGCPSLTIYKGSHIIAIGKREANSSRILSKKTRATESRPSKGVVIREPPPSVQKKKSWFSSWGSKKGKKGATIVEDPLDIADAETLDPNAEDETPSPLDSPRLPNSASHDSMTTGGSSSDAGGDGGGNGGGNGGGGGGDGGQGGGDGDSGQGGGGGGMAFTEEQFDRDATQDSSHGAPLRYNRRQKFRPDSQARGSPVDSHSYNTMVSDFERISTHESVGSYGGHSYNPESTSTDYSSGYGPYSGYTATTGYLGPSPYMYPPPAFSVHVPVQVFAHVEDV
ncbi:hypothetical protein Taro_012846 [Colocasia esculenta]|uniref:HAT C-terminal dimerisation domain-containing protein n=1 Tax=Colocasia esculenta TaxID=4460 RepID=A0A843U513_COLES|nr:hypothetical protein [Colocasia esculenta]